MNHRKAFCDTVFDGGVCDLDSMHSSTCVSLDFTNRSTSVATADFDPHVGDIGTIECARARQCHPRNVVRTGWYAVKCHGRQTAFPEVRWQHAIICDVAGVGRT